MDLSSFIKENCGRIVFGNLINEAIRSRDIEKALNLMSSYLRKRKIYTIPTVSQFKIDGSRKLGVYVFNEKDEGALFVWDLAASAQVETVLFTKKFNEAYLTSVNGDDFTYDLYVQAKGANTVQICKLVEAVLTGKIPMTKDATLSFIADSQIFESDEEEAANITEASDSVLADLKRQRENLRARIKHAERKGKDTSSLQAEFDAIAKKMADARLSVQSGVTVTATVDNDVDAYQEMFEEEERATPEERFDDMRYYINNVIAGIRPLALLCGAPGVGKTFRVKQNIKTAASRIHSGPMEQNVDWLLLKGSCTPTALYKSMHDYKNPGQLIVFDDCDSVFKDQEAINLLKAAYDSDDERWVSWNTAAPIPMPQELAEQCDDAVWNELKNRWEYPKQFLYEGGGIIITNFRAGQIDTAIRNRALICDLDFTTDEIIDLIRGLSPKIMPDVLTPEAKEQALDFLKELADKKAPVELSIRSFTLCAGIFGSDAPDKVKKRQITEQMRLQSARGGKKY